MACLLCEIAILKNSSENICAVQRCFISHKGSMVLEKKNTKVLGISNH